MEINELLNEELNLKCWFDQEYSKLEQKYRRLRTLGILCDNGDSPYDKLMELYNEAEQKRRRIQQLELQIADLKIAEENKKGDLIDA